MKRLCWLQNWDLSVESLNAAEIKIKTQDKTTPPPFQKKQNNTAGAVIHDSDLQNGTQKKIKLRWFGNPLKIPGSNNGSTEADSIIPDREEE